MTQRESPNRPREAGAFSLPELLMALALALVVATVVVRGLMGAGHAGERLALLMRERLVQRRTLALLSAEVGAAQSWAVGTGVGAECGLGGRTPVLQLEAEGRRITYSLGTAPSAIWRGRVLMRCGPAYGLWGELSAGAAQNRVILDAMAPQGLRVEQEAPGVVRLRLRQELPLSGGTVLPMELEMGAAALP
jgi:type II secretory pathway pseudopilin PulG